IKIENYLTISSLLYLMSITWINFLDMCRHVTIYLLIVLVAQADHPS
ncbi:hypothetical protein TrispH2_007953, partial [Trichoplax sp. H2]